ncbi:nicotinate-nucleotide--dimethylbenzimidazole phosphoribosyltransferase [Corynebacterium nuruki]|uniref:nicotinate-nucleotide--dimethylbenzimidazole phosphoribosyltransferase n=1 Tax=Corynebacterium nuruki TaxID=1032851 RepID=UPI002355EB80
MTVSPGSSASTASSKPAGSGLLQELAAWLRTTGTADALAATVAGSAAGPGLDPLASGPRLVGITEASGAAGDTGDESGTGATGDRLAAAMQVPTVHRDVADTPVDRARDLGAEIADRAADDGIPLLVLADPDVPDTTTAAVVGTLCNLEPVKAHSPAGRTDHAWADEVAVVRDLMFTTRSLRGGPADATKATGVLDAVGSPATAAVTGLLARAAQRRTPVILDGAASLAAALLAEALSPGSVSWWLAPHRPGGAGADAAAAVLDRLQLRPVHDRELGATAGGAGLCVLPLLQAAALSTAR